MTYLEALARAIAIGFRKSDQWDTMSPEVHQKYMDAAKGATAYMENLNDHDLKEMAALAKNIITQAYCEGLW